MNRNDGPSEVYFLVSLLKTNGPELLRTLIFLPSITVNLLDVPLQRYIQTRTFNHFTNVYTSKISEYELSESPIENGLPDLFARVGFIKLSGGQ